MAANIWCACGGIIRFSNETRCEDCYANDQKNVGKTERVKTPHLSDRQVAEGERRFAEIKALFQGGGTNVRAHQTAPRPGATTAR